MSDQIEVLIGSQEVSLVVEGGALALGMSVAQAELNQAVGEARTAADEAQDAATVAVNATVNKLNRDGTNPSAGLLNNIGAVGSAALAAGTGGALVGVQASGSGSVVRTQQDKNQDVKTAEDFGATPAASGYATATATTLALKNAIDDAINNGSKLIIRGGRYPVNGAVAANAVTSSAGLFLEFDGNVIFDVDPASTHIPYFMTFISSQMCPVSVSGGSLTILANNKVDRAITIASNGSYDGRSKVRVTAPIIVRDVFAPAGSATLAAYAINVSGPFAGAIIEDADIDGVSRDSSLNNTGDCKGIRVYGVLGPVTIVRPRIRNVLNPVQDADGVAVMGNLTSNVPDVPLATIKDGYFKDCQGRSIKTQCSHTVVENPVFERQSVVSITEGCDIDAQYGSLYLPTYGAKYRKNGATSPLGTNFVPFVVQCLWGTGPATTYVGPGEIASEVAFNGLVTLNMGANSPQHRVIVEGGTGVPLAGLSGTMLNRAVVEFNPVGLNASANKLIIDVRNVRIPNTAYLVSYNSAPSADFSGKLEIYADVGNDPVLQPVGSTDVFNTLGGTLITKLEKYRIGGTGLYNVYMPNWDVNFGTIQPGNNFLIDLSNAVVTGGPSNLPASGLARVVTGASTDPTPWVQREIIMINGGRRWYTDSGSWTEAYSMVRAPALADVGAAPTQTDFNTLLARLRTSGVLET